MAGVAVHSLAYPASIFGQWAKNEMNIHERAVNFLECFAVNGFGKRPIAFVCHSLGGILVKEILRASSESADSGWRAIVGQVRPVAIDADHISICKPKDKLDLVYTSICRHLKSTQTAIQIAAEEENHTFNSDDYTVSSENDRRDLLQKLIDAGREHEYQMANAYQNKFAQKYYRLGLFTQAKQQSDALLSSVEQRFVTHVYSDRICKNASNDEIASALQNHVIDPLSSKQGGAVKPSATAVLQALYFLTEQCYIRWDAP